MPGNRPDNAVERMLLATVSTARSGCVTCFCGERRECVRHRGNQIVHGEQLLDVRFGQTVSAWPDCIDSSPDDSNRTIDAHTAGEPLRLIVSGFPTVEGATISSSAEFGRDNYDHLRPP